MDTETRKPVLKLKAKDDISGIGDYAIYGNGRTDGFNPNSKNIDEIYVTNFKKNGLYKVNLHDKAGNSAYAECMVDIYRYDLVKKGVVDGETTKLQEFDNSEWTEDNNGLHANGRGNKSIVFNKIKNKGYTKCFIELEVTYENHNPSGTGWNCSDIAFTTEKQEQTYSPEIWNNKFKSVYFTKWDKKYDESFKK